MEPEAFWRWLLAQDTRPDSVGWLAKYARRAGVKDAATYEAWAATAGNLCGGALPHIERLYQLRAFD